MPSYAYYEEDFDEIDKFEVAKSDIENNTDVEELECWFYGLELHIGLLDAQLKAASLSGGSEPGWVMSVCRAQAFTQMGQKRIKKRLRQLGVIIGPEGAKINELNHKVMILKAERAHGIEALTVIAERYGQSVANSIGAEAARRLLEREERKAAAA